MTKVCVLGLGYIGLPTALFLAKAGNEVIGVDLDVKKVEKLSKGILPFEEPGLPELFEAAKKKIRFTTSPDDADAFIMAVPTPVVGHEPDYSFVETAAKSVAKKVREGNLVILESTVGPGASEKIVLPILNGKKILYAFCSERAIPGNTLNEMVNNVRVIGAPDENSFNSASKLYAGFVKGELLKATVKEAEMAKVIENASRDSQIAFANELARVCEELGLNVWNVIKLANRHPRVNILEPGPGVGGHCIAVDPWYLIEEVKDASFMKAARESNEKMPSFSLALVKKMVCDVSKPTIAVLGLAYKADIDDDRESPSYVFAEECSKAGYNVRLHDPHVKNRKAVSLEEALNGADCACFLVAHEEFKKIDPAKIGELMKNKNVFDAKNFLDATKWRSAGFKLKTIGDGQ
ncbi:nucleotide sugar dehydrogenase [Candidatus Micrarchaeota archaeon]|nr:nucleotide sugar dehydrogenase [Candidatus Micrarchaeota archaeon]